MEALIYARFSKLEQIGGASAKRQIEMARKLCEDNGWEHSPEREWVEEGKSAYSGANRAKGSWLFNFEREAAIGLHRGRVLVVEAVDRISRQGYSQTLDFLNALLGQGVTVATAANRRVYEAYKPVEMMEVIEVILHSELAAKESQQKSRRVRDGFAKLRAKAAAGEQNSISSRKPSWIKVEDGKPVEIKERADIVREIYRLAADGAGTTLIAKILNERGVKPWREDSNGWHEGYIYRLLTVRTVLGEFISPRHNERILGYYPSIIDVDTYNRVAAARVKRANKGAGRWSEKHTNLFSGLTRCNVCGGSMTVKPSRVAGTRERKKIDGKIVDTVCNVTSIYLVCNAAKRRVMNEDGSRRCDNLRQTRLDKIEGPILDEVLKLALDGDRFAQREASDARIALAETERLIEFKREQAGKLGENLKNQISDTLMDMLIAIENEIRALEAERAKLVDASAAELGAATSPAMIARIRETRAKLNSDDRVERMEARSMVADALRNVITDILCDRDASAMVIIASGVAAFRVTSAGVIDWRYDATGDEAAMKSLTQGAYAGNRATVEAVMKRARAINVADKPVG
jgi:DNA invertase Pin-like site-specific DNA recombinase